MGEKRDEKLTGYITCEVSGSASCRNKTIENCAQGKGGFLISFDSLPRFEGPASVAAPGSDSVTSPIVETCWPPSRGVSSSGAVGIVAIMGVQVGRGELQQGMGERVECASSPLYSERQGSLDLAKRISQSRSESSSRITVMTKRPAEPFADGSR